MQLEDATPAETEAVRQLLHQTMPDATVTRVQRNQHDLLYRQYVARRDAVDAEAGYTHERWLWNGNDSIVENMSKGFDLRYASQEFNKYGVGVYFAADAQLSAYFERSTRDSTGEKKIILARVALGQMVERSAVRGHAQLTRTASGGRQMVNPELTKPEWKTPPPGAQSATSRQRIEAIVYENHQAFPHYLVTYVAGPRPDPYRGVALNASLRKIDDAPHNSDVRVHNGKVQSFLSVAQERAAKAAAEEAARLEKAQAAEKERKERAAAEAKVAAAREEAERCAREVLEAQRRADVAQRKADTMARELEATQTTQNPVSVEPEPEPVSVPVVPIHVQNPLRASVRDALSSVPKRCTTLRSRSVVLAMLLILVVAMLASSITTSSGGDEEKGTRLVFVPFFEEPEPEPQPQDADAFTCDGVHCRSNAHCRSSGAHLYTRGTTYRSFGLFQPAGCVCDAGAGGTWNLVEAGYPNTGYRSNRAYIIGECEVCPQGWWSREGSVDLTSIIDYYDDYYVYGSSRPSVACIECGPNSDTDMEGSTTAADCVCNAGFVGDSGNCTICPQGSWSLRGQSVCTECPANFDTSGPGASSSSDCHCEAGRTGAKCELACTCCDVPASLVGFDRRGDRALPRHPGESEVTLYRCAEMYERRGGAVAVTVSCGATGQYQVAGNVACERTHCGASIVAIPHARTDACAVSEIGASCEYECDIGYAPNGVHVCNSDGTFSGGRCTGCGASAITIDRAVSTTCSGALGAVCNYTCEDGYESSGVHSCDDNGYFTGGLCIGCGNAEQYSEIPHAVSTVGRQWHVSCAGPLGAQCKYQCEQGYVVTGNHTCHIDESFRGGACIPVDCLDAMTSGLAAFDLDGIALPTSYDHGATVAGPLFACAAGYEATGVDPPYVSCGTDGQVNVTSGGLGACIASECLPIAIANSATGCGGTRTGEVCNYTCDAGYTATGTLTCLADGQFTGGDLPNASWGPFPGGECLNCIRDNRVGERCEYSCGEHGTSNGSACTCSDNFAGEYCEYSCGEHGTSENNTCLCNDGYFSEQCEHSCGEHGARDNITGACICGDGYSGSYCNFNADGVCDTSTCAWLLGSVDQSCDAVCSAAGQACMSGDWGIHSEENLRAALEAAGQRPDELCGSERAGYDADWLPGISVQYSGYFPFIPGNCYYSALNRGANPSSCTSDLISHTRFSGTYGSYWRRLCLCG